MVVGAAVVETVAAVVGIGTAAVAAGIVAEAMAVTEVGIVGKRDRERTGIEFLVMSERMAAVGENQIVVDLLPELERLFGLLPEQHVA